MDQWRRKLLSRWSLAIFKLFWVSVSNMCLSLFQGLGCDRGVHCVQHLVHQAVLQRHAHCNFLFMSLSLFFVTVASLPFIIVSFELSRSFAAVLIISEQFYLLICGSVKGLMSPHTREFLCFLPKLMLL